MRAKSCILIVDDDERGRELLESLLEPEGYLLVYAETGPQALEQATTVIPDLILLDVMMPGMDGYEVCQTLRADPILSEVPIILLTALDDRTSRLRGIETGADDFISKPYDRMELRARVRTITRLNRYRRLLTEQVKFEWVVEQAENGYLMLNEQGAIEYANSTAKRLLELPHEESGWKGLTFIDWIYQQYHCEPKSAWRNWPTQVDSNGPCYLVRPETPVQRALWLRVNSFQLLSDAGGGILVSLWDTTDQMTLQQQIWTFNTLVSHKLRTALMGMSAMRMLQHQIESKLEEEEHDLLTMTMHSMARLESQVMGILQYVDAPDIWKTGNGTTLASFLDLVDELASTLEIKVNCDLADNCTEHTLALSREGTKAVLEELLKNAKKFHPQGQPQVTVFVICDEQQRKVLVRVQDDGRHLSSEELQRVWQPYYQSEKRFTGEIQGMGLGLAVVATILWGIGGDCRLQNRTDASGLSVELILPFHLGH